MAERIVPTVAEIESAATALEPRFADSPLLTGTSLDRCGARLAIKVETLNPIRSFKGRGALALVARFAADSPGVVCASAGNFGQGIAYAFGRAGIPCRVFVAESANEGKVAAMRALGARVEVGGTSLEDAVETAREFAGSQRWRFVCDGMDPAVAAGAGTIARELTDSGARPDSVLIPVGNSALILGMASWLRHALPGVRIIGVCAEGAAAPALSWRAGQVVTTEHTGTVADGIEVRAPFPESVAAMREYVDDMVLVSETELRAAVRTIATELGLLVEGAAAAGIAALHADPEAYAGRRVATVLTGGHLPVDALRWGPEWES